ncbi:Ppx/GppA family phosphatase [Elstera cyanobacteriorum]|uniref:Uncharacterized protein n=1 Tax=Elstera cyanobacteriorum TaxID=2022747 RepID=A0A255XQE0_9PROT|nr:Ppx/GppA family phosphatase [Elstera cyanobacteriorum]MCK6443550.1 Ppx/GppA family phosphatase [Elstera cyanobacteriorum]OYQ18470.1 hypothetical protein CHR90_09280 [Elstera cyanobacteriorum]GFZ80040.1 exopolyphosphatase [Elstera cyanobacteriorum]
MPTSKRIAIIDIGSNSCRLVVYRDSSRAPLTLFNEKVMCGLGRGITATGRLNPEGRRSAIANLGRFKALTQAMNVCETLIYATAATRDAEDGPSFVAEAERVMGLPVTVIPGDEEARLSALGVLSAIPEAEGVVGDLGGGSLELIDVSRGTLGDRISLPIGPLRMMDAAENSVRRGAGLIKKALQGVEWLPRLEGRDFYAVGGAWRTLARMMMEQRHYPLHIIHHYSVPAATAASFFQRIHRMDRDTIRRRPDVSRRRADTLPWAALIYEQLFALAKPANIIFSAAGLREGALYDRLHPAVRGTDPLMASCETLVGDSRFALAHTELLRFVAPLLPKDDARLLRLTEAACRLSDIAWTEHPDYRVALAYRRVLQAQLTGIDHAGRAFLAAAIALRYGASRDALPDTIPAQLLTPQELRVASAVGVALRLGYLLSGGAPGVLDHVSLSVDADLLTLSLPTDGSVVLGDAVHRRIEALGKILEAATRIVPETGVVPAK